MTPALGDIVVYRGTQGEAWNGQQTAPALVTRVSGNDIVNLTVFPDGHPLFHRGAVRLLSEDENAMNTCFWPAV